MKLCFPSLTVLLCILFTGTVTAQQAIDNAVINNYNASVVEKVYSFVSKAKSPVTPARQKLIADYYRQNDSLITGLIKNGKPKIFIDSIKVLQQVKFNALLTPKEKFDYYTAPKSADKSSPVPYSQLSLAIKYKDSLSLPDATVTALLSKSDTLKKNKDNFYKQNTGKSFDSRAWESETMINLLTETQYTKLLYLKNKNKARNAALSDWKELESRGLVSKFDKESTIASLTSFYIARQSAYDRYAHDKLKQSDNIRMLYESKPPALNALLHARRNPGNDTIGKSYQW